MDSFSILLPRTQPGDPPYKVTIDPAGGGASPPMHGGKDPAELVPPQRFNLDVSTDVEHQTYTLGTVQPMTISGVIKDSLGSYLTSYRVVALGRWDLTPAATEVSSVCFSTDGTYSIQLSEGIVGPIEIVARPYLDNVVAATLHVSNVEPYGPQTKNIAQPTGLGSRVNLNYTIEGQSGEGAVKPVSGARVQIVGSTATSFTTGVHAVIAAEAITDDTGVATLSVLDGTAIAGTYRLHVIPPAGSPLGIIYGDTVTLGAATKVRLPQRLALSGTVVDVNGKPLADVSVSARRSLRFLWSLEGEEQAFLNEIPAATTITPDTGEFIIWVDASVASAWGHYDVFFETPDGSVAPSWAIPDVEIPRVPELATLSLDTVQIPDAAYLHGKIVDGAGDLVEGASLRVFLLLANDSVCQEVFNAPEECADDAKVLGHGESDDKGLVRFTLPRP